MKIILAISRRYEEKRLENLHSIKLTYSLFFLKKSTKIRWRQRRLVKKDTRETIHSTCFSSLASRARTFHFQQLRIIFDNIQQYVVYVSAKLTIHFLLLFQCCFHLQQKKKFFRFRGFWLKYKQRSLN